MITGTTAELAIILLLLYRSIWRRFPMFFAYSIWVVLGNTASYILFQRHFPGYSQVYLINMIVDLVLMFCVLVELGWSILRPLHGSLSRVSLLVIGVAILILGVAIWPFAGGPYMPRAAPVVVLILHIQQTFYVLRILLFVLLAGSSHFLAIGWRDRELQIATGLGATSLASLAVAFLRVYPSMSGMFQVLNNIVIFTFIASQLYWIFSFAQQEQERRQMTPQTRSMLLAVASAAHSTRIALSPPDSTRQKSGSKL